MQLPSISSGPFSDKFRFLINSGYGYVSHYTANRGIQANRGITNSTHLAAQSGIMTGTDYQVGVKMAISQFQKTQGIAQIERY